MTTTINLHLNSSNGSSEASKFQDQIKDKSPAELGEMLGKKGTEPWQKGEILNEFVKDLMGKKNDKSTAPEEKGDLEELLEAFKKSSNEEKQGGDMVSKLLQGLGVPKEIADALGEAVTKASKGEGKGKGDVEGEGEGEGGGKSGIKVSIDID